MSHRLDCPPEKVTLYLGRSINIVKVDSIPFDPNQAVRDPVSGRDTFKFVDSTTGRRCSVGSWEVGEDGGQHIIAWLKFSLRN